MKPSTPICIFLFSSRLVFVCDVHACVFVCLCLCAFFVPVLPGPVRERGRSIRRSTAGDERSQGELQQHARRPFFSLTLVLAHTAAPCSTPRTGLDRPTYIEMNNFNTFQDQQAAISTPHPPVRSFPCPFLFSF